MKEILAGLLTKKIIVVVIVVSLVGGIAGSVIYIVSQPPRGVTLISTPTPTLTPTSTPISTPTPVLTLTPVPTPTPTSMVTPIPTITPTPIVIPIPTPIPTFIPTPTFIPIPTLVPTPTPIPTSTPTPTPTLTPLPTPTPTSTQTPTPTSASTPPPLPEVVRIKGPGNAIFNYATDGYWWPGRTVEKWLRIRNVGDLPFDFHITTSGQDKPSYDTKGDGANVGLKVSFPEVEDIDGDDHDGKWHIRPCSFQKVLIRVNLPFEANNTVQGDRWDMTFTFYALEH